MNSSQANHAELCDKGEQQHEAEDAKVPKQNWGRWAVWVLILITALGAVLRLYHAETRQMWGDEIHTFEVANIPARFFEAMRLWWTTTSYINDPPLFYILGYLNVDSASTYSPLRLRLISILFGTACIPLAYRLFLRVQTRGFALAGALLCAVATFGIQYAQEYRPYAMLMFSSALFLDASVLIMERFSWRRWWYLFASSALLIYTHLFGLLALGATYILWVAVTLWRKQAPLKKSALPLLLLPAALLLLYLPMFPFMWIRAQTQAPAVNENAETAKAILKMTLGHTDYLPDLFRSFRSWRQGSFAPWTGALLGTLFFAGWGWLAYTRRRLFAAVTAWIVLSTALTVGFYMALKFHYEPRRNIFQFPVYLFLLTQGILVPAELARRLARRESWHMAGKIGSLCLLGLVVGIYGQYYVRYDARGWRDEPGQADWKAMSQFIGSMSRPDDLIVVPRAGDDTWVPLHFRFYLPQAKPKGTLVNTPDLQPLRASLQAGKDAWFVAVQPWKLPQKTWEYLIAQGQWFSFFGGSVVFLPSEKAPSPSSGLVEQTLVSNGGQAALAALRSVAKGPVRLEGAVNTTLVFDSKTTYALLELPPGVYRASWPNNASNSETTLGLFRRVEPGQWQRAMDYSQLVVKSPKNEVLLKQGEPYLSMMYNGAARYRFYVDQSGEYDLTLEAKNDKPGPISLRVWMSGVGEMPRFEFAQANNRFSTQTQSVKLSKGPNELVVYYVSFKRIQAKQSDPQDEFNSFGFSRWKLDLRR